MSDIGSGIENKLILLQHLRAPQHANVVGESEKVQNGGVNGADDRAEVFFLDDSIAEVRVEIVTDNGFYLGLFTFVGHFEILIEVRVLHDAAKAKRLGQWITLDSDSGKNAIPVVFHHFLNFCDCRS